MVVGFQDDGGRRGPEAFLGDHGPQDLDFDTGKDAAAEKQVQFLPCLLVIKL